MGGMIAQELGFIENIRNRVMLLVPHSEDTQVANIKHNIYTEALLNAPDALGPESIRKPFLTNGDRVAATKIWKRRSPQLSTRPGFLAQAIAAGWHHKSDAHLKELAEKVGPERILVVHLKGWVERRRGEEGICGGDGPCVADRDEGEIWEMV
ncbi:hypothetical protein LTS18_011383 [Coniosporium uncinatum]|uniref:Uncharacterized protein n=1 Tax=Coniosporium uncinatum TaxID=93489 RepID=A0ACC3DK11_9PEZI|nr:hypothetical protein LTS18_011383 [Coniosporium uncinatum]